MARAYIPQTQLVPFHNWLKNRVSDQSLLLELWLFCKLGKAKSSMIMPQAWALRRAPRGLTPRFLTKVDWGKLPFNRLNKNEVVRLHKAHWQQVAADEKRAEVDAANALREFKRLHPEEKEPKPKKKAAPVPSDKEPKDVEDKSLHESSIALLLKKADPEVAFLYAEYRKGATSSEDDEDFVGEDAASMAKKLEHMRKLKDFRRRVVSQGFLQGSAGSFWHTSEAADGLPFTALTASVNTTPGSELVAFAKNDGEGGTTVGKLSIGLWYKPGTKLHFVVRDGPKDIGKQLKTALDLSIVPVMTPPPSGATGGNLSDEDIRNSFDRLTTHTSRQSLARGIFWFNKGTRIRSGEIFILNSKLDPEIDKLFGSSVFLTGVFSKPARTSDPVTFVAGGNSAGDRRLLEQLYSHLTRSTVFGSRAVKVEGRGVTFPANTGNDSVSPEDLRRYSNFVTQTKGQNKTLGTQTKSGKFWFAMEGLDKKPVFVLYGFSLPLGAKDMARSTPVTGTWTRDDKAKSVTLRADSSVGSLRSLTEHVNQAHCFPFTANLK